MESVYIRRIENKLYKGDRVVNFRPILVAGLFLAAGIILEFFIGLYSLYFNFLFCGAGALIILIKKEKCSPKRIIGFTVAFCLMFSVGSISFASARYSYGEAESVSGVYYITGQVDEVVVTSGGLKLTVDNLHFLGEDSYFDSSYRINVYVYGNTDFKAGMKIGFFSEIKVYEFMEYGEVNAYPILDSIKYFASVQDSEIEVFGENFELFGSVREYLRKILFNGLDSSTASIAYAMLTGDSGYIDDGVLENFRFGGIAHIFAVSGLHIGIIYGLLFSLLKRFRMHFLIKLFLIGAVLTFYAGVCGFSPSSVRALAMCLVLAFAKLSGLKYDPLNSVSAAFILVLLINPVYLFSVGFRLSVAAAAGIIILGGTLSRLFKRIKIPAKIGSGISVCLSAQLATFPVLIDSFGYVSALSIVLNLIFVPLISSVFTVLFLFSFISCLFPFIGNFLLYIPGLLLELAVVPIIGVNWGTLLIYGFSFGACIILWFTVLFALSDKVNLRVIPKISLGTILIAVLSLCMVFENIQIGAESTISVRSRYDTDLVIIRSEKKTYCVVTGEIQPAYTERFLLQEGGLKIDVALFACEAEEANVAIPVLLRFAEVTAVYVPFGFGLGESFHSVKVEEKAGAFKLGSSTAEFVGDAALFLELENIKVLIGGIGLRTLAAFGESLPDCDLLICDKYMQKLYDATTPQSEVYFEKTVGKLNVYDSGGLQIGLKSDIISIKGRRVSDEIRIVQEKS